MLYTWFKRRTGNVVPMIEQLNEIQIKGGKFRDVFNLGGIPLLWFFQMVIIDNPSHIKKIGEGNMNERIRSKILLNGLYANTLLKIRNARKLKSQSSGKIMFLSYTNQIINKKLLRIQKVADIMKIKDIDHTILMCSPLSEPFLKRSDFDSIYAYSDQNILKKSKEDAKWIGRWWKENRSIVKVLPRNKDYKNFCAILDVLFNPKSLFIYIYHFLLFQKIFTKKKTRLTIVTNDGMPIDRCALGASESLGIKQLIIQHGYCIELNPAANLPLSHYAVWNKQSKEGIVAFGMNPRSVRITGNPAFDPAFDDNTPISEDIILIFTQAFLESGNWSKNKFERYLRYLKDIAKKGKVVIKLHPREDPKKYEPLKKDGAEVVRGNNFHYLKRAKYVVGTNSTTLYDSLALGKPVVSLDPYHIADEEEYVTRDLVLHINNTKDFERKLKNYLAWFNRNKKKVDAFAREFYYKLDGKASDRIVAYIQKLSA